jgi:MFS family permease
MLSGFQFGLANSIVFVFLPPFARFAGVPRIAPFYIVYTLMAVAVRVLGGRLADRLERRQVILPSLIGLAAGILLFSTLHSTWMLVLIAFINGTAHGFVFPATSALAFDRAPRGARGRALAVFNTAVLAGTTTGAMGFGWCAEIVGYRAGFVAFGLALAAGSAVFWRKR